MYMDLKEREREGEGGREREREGGRERGRGESDRQANWKNSLQPAESKLTGCRTRDHPQRWATRSSRCWCWGARKTGSREVVRVKGGFEEITSSGSKMW